MLNFFKKKTNKLKVIAEIYEVTPSDDLYHSLGKVKGNRQVNDINVSRLKKSIQDNNHHKEHHQSFLFQVLLDLNF